MTAFGKAENCFIGFLSLWCSQGLRMNSLASAPLPVTSNPLHKKCPKTYFLCYSCLSLRNSVLQKTNVQGSSEQRVITCNLLLLRERCFFFLTASVKAPGWTLWSAAEHLVTLPATLVAVVFSGHWWHLEISIKPTVLFRTCPRINMFLNANSLGEPIQDNKATVSQLCWKDLKGEVVVISLDKTTSRDFILKQEKLTLIGRKK